MGNKSTLEQKLAAIFKEGWMPERFLGLYESFYRGFQHALKEYPSSSKVIDASFETLLNLIKSHYLNPFIFQPYHEKIRYPFDYYAFGNDFFRPLIDEKKSKIIGDKNIQEIISHLKKGHNAVLLSNHQIEADPQAISLLLDDKYPGLAEGMIAVAGERVITDPLAVPFSMGRNLLCIYSKRYIDHPPEKKAEKQHHNKRTMEIMSMLLKEGGKLIYVAPSGGRDRRNKKGIVEVAPFDAPSIEMFYLMAQKAKTPTFFYPMALDTYDILPPPETIQVELGETRITKRGPIGLAIGSCIDMKQYPGYDLQSKHDRRQARADHIWKLVNTDYEHLKKGK